MVTAPGARPPKVATSTTGVLQLSSRAAPVLRGFQYFSRSWPTLPMKKALTFFSCPPGAFLRAPTRVLSRRVTWCFI